MQIKDLTHGQLVDLRKEISLGSYFESDYQNSFGIDKIECMDFFNGLLDDMFEFAKIDIDFAGDPDDFADVLDNYDNNNYLLSYFDSLEF